MTGHEHLWTSEVEDDEVDIFSMLHGWSTPRDYPTTSFGDQTSRLVYCGRVLCDEIGFAIGQRQ